MKNKFLSTKGYIQSVIFNIILLLFDAVLFVIAYIREVKPGMIFAGVLVLIVAFLLINNVCNAIEYTRIAKNEARLIGKISNWKRHGYYGYILMLEHEGQLYDSTPFMDSKRPEKFVSKQVEYCIINSKAFIYRVIEDEYV